MAIRAVSVPATLEVSAVALVINKLATSEIVILAESVPAFVASSAIEEVSEIVSDAVSVPATAVRIAKAEESAIDIDAVSEVAEDLAIILVSAMATPAVSGRVRLSADC